MKSIRLMTWNVLYKEKADNILALIKEIKPDILCCQELTINSPGNPNRNIPEEIAEVLGADFYFKDASKIHDENTDSNFILGNGIFSKFPIINHRHILVQRETVDSQGMKYQNRGYLEIQTQIAHKAVTVGSTHLSFVPYFEITTTRRGEVNKLMNAIKNYRSNFILTGDLNATPDTYLIKRLEELFKSAGPAHDLPTFTTKPFEYMGFKATSLDWRIDYIFTTNDIDILSSQIIKTDISDHLPIMTELQL